MSSTYAGDPTNYPTSITIPSDGDTIDVSSVNAAFEGLADRTAKVNAPLVVLADTTALKAITTPTNGMVRLVSGRGFYEFVSASGQPEADPESFTATDLTPGRWLRLAWNTVLYAVEYTGATANTNIASAVGFGDQFTQTLTYLKAGDILHIDASVAIAQLSGATQAAVRLLVTNPTPTSTNPGPIIYGPATVSYLTGCMSAQYTVTVAGTHTIAVQGKLGAGSTAEVLGTASPGASTATTPGSYIRTAVYR